MAVSYDLGYMNSTDGNIHFMNKQEIGRRFALNMRVLGYNESNLDSIGPIASDLTVVDYGTGGLKYFCANVKFLNVDPSNPLQIQSPFPPYHGIEIESGQPGPGAWSGSLWMPVVANVIGHDTLQVNVTFDGGEALANPTGLRYAWWDYPPKGLYDSFGMPAHPFVLEIPPEM